MRNPYDAMASSRSFFTDHADNFRSMWGGFPPVLSDEQAFHDFYLVDSGSGQSAATMWIVEFLEGWWAHRNDPNVLLVHYNDAKKDINTHVDKIAKFMGVELTQEERDTVLEHVSIKWMKANASKFNAPHLIKEAVEKGFIARNEDGSIPTVLKPNTLVRKGETGKGKVCVLLIEFKCFSTMKCHYYYLPR